MALGTYVSPKVLHCPECAKEGKAVAMHAYRVINVSVELHWKDDGAVTMAAQEETSFAQVVNGEDVDQNTMDSEYVECPDCGHEMPLFDAMYSEELYLTEEEITDQGGEKE